MIKKFGFLTVFFLVLLVSFVFAVDFTPQGDVNLRDTYSVVNAVNVNVTTIYLNGTLLTIGGDITAVNTNGPYLTGGAASGDVSLLLNDSYLNTTIDARDSDTTYTAGSGLNLAGTVFSLLWQSLSNFTDDLGNRGYNSLSNFSNDIDLINSTYGNNTYILQSNEANLNVNSSEYWDGLNSPSDITGLGDSQITSLSWIRLNNYPSACNSNETITTLADTVICTAISITENQISDLTHTTDTVWTITAPYLVNNSGNLDFNETKLNSTIDLRTASTTYNASSITTLEGTLDGGNLASIQSIDTNYYNVSESSGGSPLLVEINFTNITSFDSVLLRLQYTGSQGHEVEIQTRNYDSGSWEVAGSITDQSSMTELVINILDSADHVSGGNVVVRLDHVQNGVSSHDLFIDYIALQKGFTSITNFEHDSLLGRDNESNHPWALPISGVRNMSGDLNVGGNDLVNVLINWSYLQNYPSTCSASQYISAFGDSLSCASISITEAQVSDLDHFDLNVSGDTGTGTILDSEVFTVSGGGIVSTAMSGNTLTVTGSAHITDTNCSVSQSCPLILYDNNASDFAAPGDCSSGEYVQNTTITGVECSTPPDLQGVTSVTGTSPIASSGGATPAISISLLGDLITTSPITGGVNNIFPGSGTKATIGVTVLKDLVAGDGLSGGENDVFVGGDADTTLTLGTPSTLTGSTSNAVTATSHTHAITTDSSGVCASGTICAGDHTHPASQVTSGTFGTGNYVMDTNLTVERIIFEADTANHMIYDNASCIIIKAGTTTLEVCE